MTDLPFDRSYKNGTMNLIETIKLTGLIEHFNQSEQSKSFEQPFNKSINEDKELYHFFKKEQLIFLVTLLILIIVGNSLVLLTLACNKRRKPRMNYFIKHLAYSDLLVGLVSVSVDITWKITLSFNAGNLLCKLVKYSQQSVIYASTYVLVMLSLDRYDAVINPLNFNTRTNRAKHMVFLAWFLSGLLSMPAIFLNQIKIKNNLPQCWIALSTNQWRLYFTLVSLSLFFVPAFVIFYCYVCIIRTIWFQRRTSEQTTVTPNDRCTKTKENRFKSVDPFVEASKQEALLNNDQLLSSEPFVDQFTSANQTGQIEADQFTATTNTGSTTGEHIHIRPEFSKFRDRLSLKLNSIAHSSMWPNSTTTDKYNDKYADKFSNPLNDSYGETIDRQPVSRTLSGKPLFGTTRSILQKHHSFDQAFNRNTLAERVRMNPKLHFIKEHSKPPELTATQLKVDLIPVKKNSCMRINSQGIIPKARVKTLKMTFVIITVFIFCWSPYILYDLLQVYGYIPRSATTNAISTFIQSLAPLNSAANPLIFCFFSSKEVFQTIKLIWKRLLRRGRPEDKLEHIHNRSLTNTTIRKNNASPTTSVCTTKSTSLSRSKSTEN